jgi:site-specific recombinase XerD
MTTTAAPPNLGSYVQAFFSDYLTAQRDLSPNTVLSYRDTFKLLLVFAARRHRKEVAELGFRDIDPATVLAFLEDLETTRGSSVRTRNVRLAGLHTFFRYVAAHEPRLLDLCQRISAIPVKKAQPPIPVYVEYDEVTHILDIIDRSTTIGRRDYLLIRLLFETGCRAQEIANLKASAFRLSTPYQVRILGKGRKERLCPLRASTAALIRSQLREKPSSGTITQDLPLFVGTRGEALTRYGVLRVVQRHVRRASQTLCTLKAKQVGAHSFRHAAAIYLLRSGNDLSVVRSWLGHVSVVTTDHYTEIDLDMKRRALETTEPVPGPRSRPSWKNPDLLSWLEAL